jgi:hypothetical protein
MKNPKLILVIGNIGTGKTSFIQKLKKRDRVFIHNDDYKDDIQRFNRAIMEGLALGKTVVLEGNYMTRAIRTHGIIQSLKMYFQDCEFICFNFGSGDSETLQRRLSETNDLDKENVIKVHNKYQRQYVKPILSEGFTKIIQKR